jgi:two-component system sensor histidine kinase CpxA
MRVRFPLSVKILLWFGLNLAFLALVFYVFVQAQFGIGLDSLLMGRAGDRIQVMTDVVIRELDRSPRAEWDDLLKQFSAIYQVKLVLFRNEGSQVAGEKMTLPAEVAGKLLPPKGLLGRQMPPLSDRRPGPLQDGEGEEAGQPPFEPGPGFRPEGRPFRPQGAPGTQGGPGLRGPQGLPPKFMLHSTGPSQYWVGVRIRMVEYQRLGPVPLTLLAVSDSIRGGGLFFDFLPWVAVGFACVLVSVLFWLPLVRGITHSISQITRATEQIAEGRFEARVAAGRRDELGRLGQAINQMASRLSGFVTGQKRFLGDIAHELCSPIARIQLALGILEHRADEKQKAYVDDLREEVQEMSGLVNELLSFSKASLEPTAIKLQPVQLRLIVEKAVRRESEGAEVRIDVNTDLSVIAEPELLLRALANLIRNAVRYAGKAGPITVSARREPGQILITVADCGPGVPEEALAQLFDPFYRVELSRNRELGGVGLGLAIVKTCIESCQGTVRCRNGQPSGLEVLISLRGV